MTDCPHGRKLRQYASATYPFRWCEVCDGPAALIHPLSVEVLDTHAAVWFNEIMNATTPQHPQPEYWFMVGRKLGQAGNWSAIDPSDYGRVFADDDPPAEWIDAVNLGIRQGFEDLMSTDARPCEIAVTRNWAHRLAARLNDWSIRVEAWADR